MYFTALAKRFPTTSSAIQIYSWAWRKFYPVRIFAVFPIDLLISLCLEVVPDLLLDICSTDDREGPMATRSDLCRDAVDDDTLSSSPAPSCPAHIKLLTVFEPLVDQTLLILLIAIILLKNLETSVGGTFI